MTAKTKEEILMGNCPVFEPLFHDKTNKASVMMKESILKSMSEFASQEVRADRERLKAEITSEEITLSAQGE